MKVESITKIILSILLFICLLKMPYGYYQLIRFIALVSFIFLAYQSNQSHKQIAVFIYIALAILFQPIFKISFGRQLWNIIDVIVGFGLLATVIKALKQKSDSLKSRIWVST